MFGPALDTAIGLSLTFFLVALLCSALVEAAANLLKKRAKYLLRGLRDMLDTPVTLDRATLATGIKAVGAAARSEKEIYQAALEAAPSLLGPATVDHSKADHSAPPSPDDRLPIEPPTVARLMGHPLLTALKQSRAGGGMTRNPSYVPARTFTAALLDLIVPDAAGQTTIDRINGAVSELPETPLRGALLALLKDAGDDVDRFKNNLEHWYDAQMDRVSGSYKRWAKRWLIVFGLAAALILNVDALQVGRTLYSDEPLRQAVAASATNGTLCEQGQDFDQTRACVTSTLDDLDAAGLPVGWSDADLPDDAGGWLTKLLGLLLTAGAATFGAPFWFDLLNRFGSLRNAGTKPQSTSSP